MKVEKKYFKSLGQITLKIHISLSREKAEFI